MPSGQGPGEAIRAHDPAAFVRSLAYRDRTELPYDPTAIAQGDCLMLDTTVYVDQLQRALPTSIQRLLVGTRVLHDGMACAELSIAVGLLDPADPRTPGHRDPIVELFEAMNELNMTQPSASAWTEAGVLAGILARSQGILTKSSPAETPLERCCRQGRQRSLLHDTLIFLSAWEHGAVLVSRNRKHMDLLLQIRPEVRVLLYDRQKPMPADSQP